jgi:hypothetical protein
MARAFIVLVRNDISDNLLQVLDLKPYTTPSIGTRVYSPPSQGGYQTFYTRDGVNGNVTTQAGAGGGASLDTDGDTYGLAAYLLDNVEDSAGTESLTAAEANTIAGLIYADAAAGTALTLARVNVHINTPAGVGDSDLDGTVGNSTGSLLDILRILSGERYFLPDNSQVRAAAGTFDAVVRGYFVTAPNVEVPASVRTTHGVDRAIRGRKSTAPPPFLRPGEPRGGQAPVQTGTQNVLYNAVRVCLDTPDLHLSCANGALSRLKSATYAFENAAFTYGGGANPATTIANANIAAGGVARAVVVYDADGNVI